VRRTLLIAALVVLVLLDLALVPESLLLIFLGSGLASLSHGASIGMAAFGLVVAAVPLTLTVVVAKAARLTRGAGRA
jgi:hypothetical protein